MARENLSEDRKLQLHLAEARRVRWGQPCQSLVQRD
jgi:hypothetical protein